MGEDAEPLGRSARGSDAVRRAGYPVPLALHDEVMLVEFVDGSPE